MTFNNPIGSEKADRLVDLLPLGPKSRTLDAGCGTGEFLLRVIARHGGHGVGIDRDPKCIEAARQSAAARALAPRCEFHAVDANAFEVARGAFDAGICIGSSHAFGAGDAAFPNTIAHLQQWVRPGGCVLLGEGYWKQEPAPEYLQLLGDPVGIYRDHAGNIAFAEERGLIPLYAVVSSDDEWDHFEWSHLLQIRCEAEADPADPVLAARLARSRVWRDGYLRWGRSTMGFGLYLFHLPG